MVQNLVRKSSQKNFELDYTFSLEVSIKGNELSCTDDKAKRYEINKRLVRIAATATAAYRKITGRVKEQLDKNVKKKNKSICLKINHNHDSWTSRIIMITNYNRQLAESKVKNWGVKRTSKNIEKKNNPTAENSLAKVFSSRCPPC